MDRLREKQYISLTLQGRHINYMRSCIHKDLLPINCDGMRVKNSVKFQKNQHETVRRVALTRYLLHIHFNSVRHKKKSLSYKCSVRCKKKSKLKMRKK